MAVCPLLNTGFLQPDTAGQKDAFTEPAGWCTRLDVKKWADSTTSSQKLTLPLAPCHHSDVDGEGGVFRLVIMHQGHVPTPEGLLGSESDLRLGERITFSGH